MTNDVEVITTSVKIVQTACCDCGWCVCERICQIVIAAFAVFSGLWVLVRKRFDSRVEAPKLALDFDDSSKYCVVVDDDVEGGGAHIDKKVNLRVKLENIGANIASECKVIVDDVFVFAGKKATQISNRGQRSLHTEESVDSCSCTLRSGEEVYFDLGSVRAEQADLKGADAESVPGKTHAACIELHYCSGLSTCLLPHQNHIKIPLKVCAAGFAPHRYEIDFDWRGGFVSAIGTTGSIVAECKEVKK